LLFLFASLEALLLPRREQIKDVSLERRATTAAELGGVPVPTKLATGAARNQTRVLCLAPQTNAEADAWCTTNLVRISLPGR